MEKYLKAAVGTLIMSIDDEADTLRKIPVFGSLEANKIRLLAFASDLIEYPDGKTILRQGDYGDSVFVTIEGNVEIEIFNGANKSRKREYGQHSIFGELSIIRGTLRAATVTAKTDVVVLKISKDALETMMDDQPSLRAALEKYIEQAGYDDE